MSYNSFCVLHKKLEQGILDALDKRKIKGAKQHDRAPPIPNGVRLASALRYFAGGSLLDGDSNNIVNNINGSVPLEQTDDIDVARPLQLLGGGDHFDDHPRELRRNQTGAELPRQILLEKVVESHLRRPNQNR